MKLKQKKNCDINWNGDNNSVFQQIISPKYRIYSNTWSLFRVSRSLRNLMDLFSGYVNVFPLKCDNDAFWIIMLFKCNCLTHQKQYLTKISFW